MQQIYNGLSIGLKFKLRDLVNKLDDANYALYEHILENVHISDEEGDEVNTAYQDVIRESWDKDELLESLANLHTESYGDLDILDYDCVIDVKRIYQGQHDYNPRGGNVQTISIETMMRAINEEISVLDRNKRVVDLALLPPFEKVVSLFTELIE
jgi:hypothetical protein